MPSLATLYSFRRCPYAIRARLAIRASGIKVVLREVALRSKPPEMLAISPKGTVPVLQLPSGAVIEQSLDIMRWALKQHDPHGWLSPDSADEAQALINTNDGPFKRLLDAYKYPDRHPQHAAHHYRDQAIALLLTPMNARLQRHAHLMGDSTHLVDMALLPFIRQFAQVDADWFAQAPLPALQNWLHAHLNSPLFDSVMNKYPVWSTEQSPLIFD
jgi:glutathione S-transferase